MSVAAVGVVPAVPSAVTGVTGTGFIAATDASSAATAASASGSAAFGNALTSSIDSLQGLQSTSDNLAVKAVTGDLTDVHSYTIAASEAKVALEVTSALRNKAIDAFTEIMRMQA